MTRKFGAFAALATAFLATTGCSFSGGTQAVPQAQPRFAETPENSALRSHIKHVILIVQENRSFENFFAGWPGSRRAPMYGFNEAGKKIPLHPISFHDQIPDHEYAAAMIDLNGGKMNGFDRAPTTPGNNGTSLYAYVDPKYIKPYRTMASRYVLADRMFPTELSESFTAHLDLISSTTNISPTEALVDIPNPASNWGCDASVGTVTSLITASGLYRSNRGPFPCFTQFRTIADTLDAARVSWKFYSVPVGISGWGWTSFQAIRNVRYGPDWPNIVTPQTKVLTDVAHGKLAQMSWVLPDALDSDHPGEWSFTGPSWVASVVNAIGESTYWKDSAIIVVWDDWGGWFDSEKPPHESFVGAGIRVPCLIISPYARKGYVDDTLYEFGSILHFVENVYGLPPLGPAAQGYTDGTTSIEKAFDFVHKPRPFKPIPAEYSAHYFLTRPPSRIPPDTD